MVSGEHGMLLCRAVFATQPQHGGSSAESEFWESVATNAPGEEDGFYLEMGMVRGV